jgi:hypothetical protein
LALARAAFNLSAAAADGFLPLPGFLAGASVAASAAATSSALAAFDTVASASVDIFPATVSAAVLFLVSSLMSFFVFDICKLSTRLPPGS